MTYDLAPAHADTDAPLPSGIAYEATTEPHQGCPRGGYLAWRIDDFTGASVSCCTRCQFRRVYAMTTATAEALRLQAEAEAAGDPEPTPAIPATDTNTCAAPNCRRPAARTYCSAACYRAHRHHQAVALGRAFTQRAEACACGCGAGLTRQQTRYATLDCRRRDEATRRAGRRTVCACGCERALTGPQTMYASTRCRRDADIRRGIARREARAAEAAPVIPAVATAPCVDCSTPVPRSRHARRDSVPRCGACQAAADQQRLDAYWAAQRAGAGQVAA